MYSAPSFLMSVILCSFVFFLFFFPSTFCVNSGVAILSKRNELGYLTHSICFGWQVTIMYLTSFWCLSRYDGYSWGIMQSHQHWTNQPRLRIESVTLRSYSTAYLDRSFMYENVILLTIPCPTAATCYNDDNWIFIL